MPRSKRAGLTGQTLRRRERIRRRADYVQIQESARKIRSPNLLAFTARSHTFSLRLGITVSRRVGGAVVRNHVKRLIRETFRRNKLCFPQGFDIVVVARSEALRATFDQISQDIAEIARQIRKLAESKDI